MSSTESTEYVSRRDRRNRGTDAQAASSSSASSSTGNIPCPGVTDNNTTSEADFNNAESIMKNPQEMKKIMNAFSENPESFNSAVNAIENNPQVKRKAMRLARKTNVKDKLSNMSVKEKKKMMKVAKRAKNAQTLPNMNEDGYHAVTITPSRKYKRVLIPHNFEANPMFEKWTKLVLKDDIVMVFNPENTIKNRLASRIAGVIVGNDVVIMRISTNGRVADLEVDELETIFPTSNKTQ